MTKRKVTLEELNRALIAWQKSRGQGSVLSDKYTTRSDNTRVNTAPVRVAKTETAKHEAKQKANQSPLAGINPNARRAIEQIARENIERREADRLGQIMGTIQPIDIEHPTESTLRSIDQMGLNVDPTTSTFRSPGSAYAKGLSLAKGTAMAAPLFAGFTAAPIQTGTSLLTGIGGDYAGRKLGDYVAKEQNLSPEGHAWMTNGLGFVGGLVGGGLGYKGSDLVKNNYSIMLPRPYGENTMYRQGTRAIVDDAYDKGFVLPQSAENIAKAAANAPKFQTPDGQWHTLYKAFDNNVMFKKGVPFYGDTAVGANPKLGYKSVIVVDFNNPKIQWNKVHHKGHKDIYEPTTNGILGSGADNFDYWQRMPLNLGWYKKSPYRGDVSNQRLAAAKIANDIDEGVFNSDEYTLRNRGLASTDSGWLATPESTPFIRASKARESIIPISPSQNTKSAFISELDWSPESWFATRYNPNERLPYTYDNPSGYTKQEVEELNNMIPELHSIEENAKKDGTWLKNPDGTDWQGALGGGGDIIKDPRYWVMERSSNFKDNWTQGLNLYGSGVPAYNTRTLPSFAEESWMSDDPNVYKSFANMKDYWGYDPFSPEGVVVNLTYPRVAKTHSTDFNGSDWNGTKVVAGKDPSNANIVFTDLHANGQVSKDVADGYDISLLKDLYEGPVQFKKNRLPGTDIVIHKTTPRKSIWGNTGKFDVKKPYDIYRLFPFVLTLPAINNNE